MDADLQLTRLLSAARLGLHLNLILIRKVDSLMATLAELQADVTAEDTVVDSAIALLQGLAAQVAALTPDQASIDALAADITAKSQALADAVTANTPVAAAAPPAPA